MLNQQTINKLYELKLTGMADAFADQIKQPDIHVHGESILTRDFQPEGDFLKVRIRFTLELIAGFNLLDYFRKSEISGIT